MIEWTVSLGNIITSIMTLVGFVIGGIAFVWATRTEVAVIDRRIGTVEAGLHEIKLDIKETRTVMTVVAEQKAEIRQLREEIRDIRQHGSHKLAEILQQAFRGGEQRR